MGTKTENLEYKFGEFRMSNSRQVLFRGSERVALSTKIYYLLLTLVKNTGQVLSKDEIIETVWPGQVVTDTALAQQILRLRQLLEDNNRKQPYIETHRGIGYRFTVPVVVEEVHPANPLAKPASRPTWLGYALLAVILLATVSIVRKTNNPIEDNTDFLVAGLPISLAIIPTQNSEDWLNTGGLDYLAELLGQHNQIYAISPETEWYASESPEKLAINLTTNENINYSFLIGLKEVENGYIADLELRTQNSILAGTEIQAGSLPELFEQTNTWVSHNLSVRDQVENIENSAMHMTTDAFALQSYLQGVFEIKVDGNQQKAAEYFQAALNKDPDFLPAWIGLAEAKMAQSEFEKAIAIANTYLGHPGALSGSLAAIRLNFIKAKSYFSLRDEERALESINSSVISVKSTNDPYLKLAGLKSLTLLANLQGDWEAAEARTLERLEISKKYLPLGDQLAGIYLELAKIYERQRQVKKAREQLNLSIKFYEETGNTNGMVSAFSTLNTLNFLFNSFDEGVQVTTRAEPYLEKSTSSYELILYYQASTMILNLRGRFDRSDIYIDRIRKIAQQTNNKFYLLLSEFMKVHKYYVQNRFDLARQHTDSMRTAFENNQFLPSSQEYFSTLDILISSRADPPEKTLALWKAYLLQFPQLPEKHPLQLMRAEGHISVRQGQVEKGVAILKSTEQKQRDQGQIHLANYIGYETLEILLQYPEMEYKDTIARLEANTEYDYLFFKLKAEFQARENSYYEAVRLMQENKLRANQLWKPEDQLLLEQYQRKSQQSL